MSHSKNSEMSKLRFLIIVLAALAVGVSCTSDFDEINTNKQGFTAEDVSAKFFLTSSQVGLYAPNRFVYWRAHLIHSDRFAGHFTFGNSSSWWNDGLSYNYNSAYTDATYGWLAGYFGTVKSFADLTEPGGEFENEYYYAISQIMKGLYYQLYTETFGMVPYTEAGVDGILEPAYDDQDVIYQGIIAELDQAMATIGSETSTGAGVEDAGSNDIWLGGDLQKWKALANTLKLRIGMRALGATGGSFANTAITEALAAPLLDNTTGSAVMVKDFVISEWASSSYGDVWHDFGGNGSNFSVSSVMINYLQDYADPRLSVYADPIVGGSFTFDDDGSDPNFADRITFLTDTYDAAGATYSVSVNGTETTIDLDAGQFIGQPPRTNGDTRPFLNRAMFSEPTNTVIQPRGEQVDAYPEIIISSADAYFLRAEAAVRGLSGEDAQMMMESGIREAMALWDISGGDADTYIANSALADITGGTMDEKLEKIAIQRWIAAYTDGFEAWAIVRKTGYPTELAMGVSDNVIFEPGDLNGVYPQRLRYGNSAQASSAYAAAIAIQGADVQATPLWFTK